MQHQSQIKQWIKQSTGKGIFLVINKYYTHLSICLTFRLKNVWKDIPGIEVKYWDALSTLETTSQSIVFSCFMLENVRNNKTAELLSSMTKSILDSFIKLTISTKVKPDDYVVELCTPLLKHLTHEEFKGLTGTNVVKANLFKFK